MIGFTKTTDLHFASNAKRSRLYGELLAIAAMGGILALAFGVRLWALYPRLFE